MLAPPQQPQQHEEQQHEEPAAADEEEEPQLGLDDADGGFQYPMESGKGETDRGGGEVGIARL